MDRLAPHRHFLLFTFSLMAVGAIVVALQLLASAGTASADHDPVTICHVDGQGVGHTITVDDNALAGHFNENDTPREGHLSDYMGACLVTEATSTATAAGQTIETPTATMTTVATSPTATSTTEAATSTATSTTEAATSTSTEVPATATETPVSLAVVTNTPSSQSIVSSESLGGTQGGANGGVQQGVSGAQGGGNGAVQEVQSGTQGGGNGAVAGAAQLPSTGTGGAGSSSNGMLYFGIALMLLGAGLGGTRILLARR